MNLFASLDLGRRALFASRLALDVAGNNIANVNTPGFSRRRVDLRETPPTLFGNIYYGTGVSTLNVSRLVDRLLEAQVRAEQESVGRHTTTSDGLSRIESLIGETGGDGISGALSGFYTAFSALAGAADDPALRRDVAARADTLASTIRGAASGLRQFRLDTDSAATDTIASINVLTKDIAALNLEIRLAEPGATEASDLRDARAVKVRELAELVDINVAEGSRGSVHISFAATGDTLVNDDTAHAVVVARDSSGLARVQIGRAGTLVDITDRVRGGKLGGLLAVRDDVATANKAQLDLLATDLITRVNALHTAGFDLNGVAGGDFFVPTPAGASASETLSISTAILADPSLIAAGTAASVGDGSNALAIAALESQASAALGGITSTDLLANLQAKVGLDSKSASSSLETAQFGLVAALNRIDSVSGVNLDEEATALLQYQRSYEAAAKFIQVVNEISRTALETFGI